MPTVEKIGFMGGIITVLTPDLQGAWVDDIGRRAFDEVDDVVKSGAKEHFVAVLLDIAYMRRANTVFQS